MSDPLKAISPLDGRYSKNTEPLSGYFSEHALIRYRTRIEIEYLISLSLEKGVEELNPFSEKDQQKLRKIYTSFNLEDSKRVKAIEEATKNLNEVLTPLTQKLYPQAEEGSSETADENSSDENTVDAEFEEVKEEEK